MKKSILLGLGACALALGGVAALVGQKGAVETKAEYASTRRIYLNLNDAAWWMNGDGVSNNPNNVGLKYWRAGDAAVTVTTTAVPCSFVGLDYLYVFDIPTNVDGFLFMACKNEVAWWNKSYQTNDIAFDGTKNVITLNDAGYEQAYNYSWSTLPGAASGTVYLINGNGWKAPHVHYWGDASASEWPGEAMDKVDDITLTANSTSYEIWSCVVPSSRYVKFNDGKAENGESTGEEPTVENGIYFKTVSGKYTPVVELLLKIKSSLASANIASDGDKEYAKSVCGISPENAGLIKSAYSTLIGDADADIVAATQNSTLTTYNPANYASEAPVAIKDIIAQLGGVAGAKATLTNPETNNGIGLLVGAISIGALLSVGGLFLLRKRKAE